MKPPDDNAPAEQAEEHNSLAAPQTAVEEAADGHGRLHANLPTLYRDSAFWGLMVTQFLGAFNDNLFKQLMLLLAIPVAAGLQSTGIDKQGLATIIFSLPFVVLSGYAGYLSDRHGKRGIIILSKVAEIAVMALGLLAFLSFTSTGYLGLLVVLFLMGAQSTFFGPGKYGILPEMFRESDLPRVNAVILMTTFVAIIFGTGSAGVLGDTFMGAGAEPYAATGLWRGSLICVGIAILGTISSFWVRRVPVAEPGLKFRLSSLTVTPEVRRVVWHDRPLVRAIAASSLFWMVGGIAIQVVNSFGRVQLELSQTKTSAMAAIVAIGIAGGAILAGKLSHGRADFRLVRIGAWGMVALYGVLGISLPGGQHLFGFAGSLAVLVLLGVMTGLFAIPIQVFIQARPPEGLKGRTIAFMNQVNFAAIMLAGGVYFCFDRIVTWNDLPRSWMFTMTGLLMLPVAILYRPRHDDE